MKGAAEIVATERLLLRQWREEDFPQFAHMNADPEVMEYFPQLLSREESDTFATHIMQLIEKRGWGLWALELKDEKTFVGFTGLHESWSGLPFPQEIEIGWRLAKPFWGRGLACEAAKRVLQYGFEELNLHKIISFTSVINLRSQRLMARIGLQDTGRNFAHPKVPVGPLREHVLFELHRTEYGKKN